MKCKVQYLDLDTKKLVTTKCNNFSFGENYVMFLPGEVLPTEPPYNHINIEFLKITGHYSEFGAEFRIEGFQNLTLPQGAERGGEYTRTWTTIIIKNE